MPSPPRVDPPLVAALRADLTVAAYTVDGVRAAIGPVADAALHREQPLPADLATRASREPTAVLARCFALGMPVPTDALDSALPSLTTRGAVALGLVETSAGEARATCDLRPYGDESHDWWVVSDQSETARGGPLPPHHVLGVGPASATVAQWTPRRPVRRALDLGTGCGIQALHLVGHADHLVGTDLSERALAFAGFTTGLNDVEVELRHGNLFEPVAGERFDLIVCNPPFVITPRRPGIATYEYRDAGLVGDAVVERLVRTAGDHLEPGGVALFIGNWEVPAGEDWRDIWTRWLEGTGLDAWVVQRDEQDPAEYAELWAGDAGSRSGTPGFEDLYAGWLADFAQRGVERVGFGVVALQTPTTARKPWTELVDHRGPVAAAMGPVVNAGLRARTWLAEHDDDALLDVAWSCAPDVTEERHGRPGAPDPEVIQLRQGGGLGRVVRLDTVAAGLVGVSDGTLTARQALDAIATLLDQTEADVITAAIPTLRTLVADGLLI
ncbi:MAG TPA: class I SAM-dependent methyltransferase [Lapillicoccus sp.]|nr:class I SAM-dependent methyltransferase [Lapillicoccus sp.]